MRTLAIDLDPQGNLSDYLDVPPTPSRRSPTSSTGARRRAEAIHDGIVPANLSLAEAELTLGGKIGRELTLQAGAREGAATTTS